MHGSTEYHAWSFSDSDAAFRRDRLRIILRPCVTRHKFRLFTGFATGRPTEHPPGRPLRNRIQAMGMSAGRKKNTRPTALCVGAVPSLLARQVPTSGRRKTVAKTDSCGWRPVVRFDHNPCRYDGRLLRATNDEPRATIFSRAEGYSRRCSQFEFVAAKRHLSPRRPATGGAVGPKIKKFKFFCFFRRNLHPRVEYYAYKGRDHKE